MSRIHYDLSGMNVAVLGASSGIGLATVRMAAASGATVAAGARSEERRRQAAATLGDLDASVRWHSVDIHDAAALGAMFESIAPIDVLALCATGAERARGPFLDIGLEGFRGAFGKLWGYANAVQTAAPHLAEQAGVVLVGGAVARKCPPGFVGISSVGNAVEGFCRALAPELAPRRINVVAPGTIATGMFDNVPEEQRVAMYEQLGAGLPLGRVGEAEEVADAILATALNPYMTGTTVDVDGGYLLP